MPIHKVALLALAASLAFTPLTFAQDTSTVVVDPAIAAMTVDQMVEARKSGMKQNGMTLRGAAALTGSDAVAAATTLLQNFTNMPALFPEGSITANSKALPAIWENWDEFKAIFDADAEAATLMLAAAQSGDNAAYTGAIQKIGESCNTCHQKFRAP